MKASFYKTLIFVYAIIFLATLGYSLRTVNSRQIPTANDFIAEGAGPRYAKAESLYAECANILSATKNSDQIDVGRAYIDTISDNPIMDSLTGITDLTSGAGGVTIDTIEKTVIADSIQVGSAGNAISKITVSADSIYFYIADSTYAIPTNTYVTP